MPSFDEHAAFTDKAGSFRSLYKSGAVVSGSSGRENVEFSADFLYTGYAVLRFRVKIVAVAAYDLPPGQCNSIFSEIAVLIAIFNPTGLDCGRLFVGNTCFGRCVCGRDRNFSDDDFFRDLIL